MQHIKILTEEIGPRPLGSRNNKKAEEYIRTVFSASGLLVEEQEFSCPLWEEQSVELIVKGYPHPARANVFSPSCDVRASSVALGTLFELEKADLGGKIAILYGDLTKGTGIASSQGFYFPDRDRKIIRLLEQKKPEAVITVHSRQNSLEPLIRDWDLVIPSVSVAAETGRLLLEESDQDLGIRIVAERQPSVFCNLIGRKQGYSVGRVILCAHFDSVTGSPGALDNASGIEVLLSLSKTLGQQEFPFSLEFLALNGEENGGIGDAVYLSRLGETLGQVVALINIDGVGSLLGTNSVTVMGESPRLHDLVRSIYDQFPGMLRVEPWYESDHSAYYFRGVPCVALSSIGISSITHMPSDTMEWLSERKLREAEDFLSRLVEGLKEYAIR